MAEPLQLRRGRKEWWDANSTVILRDGEPGYEKNLVDGEWVYSQHKVGDGVHTWAELPYQGVGPQGIQGPQGTFSSIESKEGVIVSQNLTIPSADNAGTFVFVTNTAKEWQVGNFVQITADVAPANYMIGQVTAYDPGTGTMGVNVAINGFAGSGTFSAWHITYAPGAGVVYNHANSHRTGGADAIPEATASIAGLLSATLKAKLDKYQAAGIYVSDVQPPNLQIGEIWFSTSQQITNPPLMGLISDQWSLLNTAKEISVTLSHDTDVDSVTLTFASSNTSAVPLSAITKSGTGTSRTVTIAGRTGSCQSVITITATDANGLFTSQVFTFTAVANAYTITASNSTSVGWGTISPIGAITVPSGGTLALTGIGADGYAIDTVNIDGAGPVLADAYTFTNVTANHTIVAAFNTAYPITAAAPANGTITPVGVSHVCNGHSKTYTFTPATGFENKGYYVDGVYTASSNNSYTFTSVTGPHNITCEFDSLDYSVTISAGTHGVITTTPEGVTSITPPGSITFNYTPDQYYEILSASYTIVGTPNVPVTGALSGFSFTVPNVTNDITAYCTFRIQLPLQVSGFTATDAGSGTVVNLAWTSDLRVVTYSVYWSTNPADTTAVQIIARGNAPLTTASTSYSHTGLTQNTAYKYCVVGVNATGTGTASSVQTATPTTNVAPTSTIVLVKQPLH